MVKYLSMEITDQNFKDQVLDEEFLVLVDFWAPWCQPCLMMGPIVEELAEKWKGKLKAVKVNVDENQSLAREYGIMSIPALFLFKNGQVAKQWVGVRNKEELEKEIGRMINDQ